MRNILYEQIHKLSFGYHDRAQTGQLLTRATSDVDRVQMFVGRGFIMFLTALIMIVGSLILLFSLDWQLALIMVVLMPLTMAIFIYFATRAAPAVHQGAAVPVASQYGAAGEPGRGARGQGLCPRALRAGTRSRRPTRT